MSKRLLTLILLCFPFLVIAASSQNYDLSQESLGFVEFDGGSLNFDFKSSLGSVGVGQSTSGNYIIDQGRVWSITTTPVVPPGGGGGGGGGGSNNVDTGIIFSGWAYPSSEVRLLKDGQIIASTVAGPDAQFSIEAVDLNSGNHTFVVMGIDSVGITSQQYSFPITLTNGVTATISGVFLAPTLGVDKKQVRQGDNIGIFGRTIPEGDVVIGVASEVETFRTVPSDGNGAFFYAMDTSFLEIGDHETRAKSAKDGIISEFGRTVHFVVDNENILNDTVGCAQKGDLNNDCRVNLIDFSIAGFWYNKQLTGTITNRETLQLNGDSTINLVDLSIMAFHWTG